MNRANSSALLTVSTSSFARMSLATRWPMAAQLSFLVHAGYVIARIADRAQRAAVFGRQRAV
jgi:hypothetical protein